MKLYNDQQDKPYWGRIVGLVIAMGVLVTAVGLGIYALTYATADTRGRIALHNQQRSPAELQFNYEYFHNTCHDIIAKTQQLATAQQTYDAKVKADQGKNDPFGQSASAEQQLLTDVTGIKNLRDQEAQDYNSRSHQFTRNFIKSKDLPAEIGPLSGVSYDNLTCEGVQQ